MSVAARQPARVPEPQARWADLLHRSERRAEMEPPPFGWLRARGSSERVPVQAAMEHSRSRGSRPTMGPTPALLLESHLPGEQPTRRAAAHWQERTLRPLREQALPAPERAAPPAHVQALRHPQRQTVS